MTDTPPEPPDVGPEGPAQENDPPPSPMVALKGSVTAVGIEDRAVSTKGAGWSRYCALSWSPWSLPPGVVAN